MKKVILFDLDGTLLPMDQEDFIGAYFNILMKKLVELGLPVRNEDDKRALGEAVWKSTYAVMKNDGSCTNEDRFFSTFKQLTGLDLMDKREELDKFYSGDFNKVSAVCGKNSKVAQIICRLKSKGVRIAVATNPLFPLSANKSRLNWAGLSLEEFEFCTCYENSCFAKPNLDYYRAIVEKLGVSADDCMMVGNDVREDMVARELGMDVFLITDCLINPDGRDINEFAHGNWDDFEKYVFEN